LVGIDGVSLWLVILSAFLMPYCILVSWQSIDHRIKEFYILLLIIEFLLFNVFSVLDIFWFYTFFEGILLPMFILIGVYGTRSVKYKLLISFFCTL